MVNGSSYGGGGEMWMRMLENGTQQYQSLDSTAALRAASILFCQREPQPQNETDEQQQKYFDKLRPTQRTSYTSTSSTDNSTYVYDNSTSESIYSVFFC